VLNTVTHEAGHYLGLGHSRVAGSTMAPYGGRGDLEKRTLEDDDRAGYCALDLPEPDDGDAKCDAPIFTQGGGPLSASRPRSSSPSAGCQVGVVHDATDGWAAVVAALLMLMFVPIRRRAPRG
jgi:hypothetical protein